jgi:hypothetical protein
MAYASLEKKREYHRQYVKSPQYKKWRTKWRRTEAGKKYRLRATKKRAERNKLWVDALKLLIGCQDCGFNKWPEALDFDHHDPQTKLRNIAAMLTLSPSKIAAEIMKCTVRCANCHRHKTWRNNE